jgi:hypothetical protein
MHFELEAGRTALLALVTGTFKRCGSHPVPLGLRRSLAQEVSTAGRVVPASKLSRRGPCRDAREVADA